MDGTGQLRIDEYSTVTMADDVSMGFSTFNNTGSLLLNDHKLTFTSTTGLTFTNTGTFDIGSQTLDFASAGGASFSNDYPGTVDGTGTFRTSGTVSLNGGIFNPPVMVASGTTTSGSMYNNSLTVASGATLQFSGHLYVDGDLNVGGALTGGAYSTLDFWGASFSYTGSEFSVVNVYFYRSGVQTLSGSGFANWTASGRLMLSQTAR